MQNKSHLMEELKNRPCNEKLDEEAPHEADADTRCQYRQNAVKQNCLMKRLLTGINLDETGWYRKGGYLSIADQFGIPYSLYRRR